jgi:dTDP-4-dehydrorhamnose 3,5-epimerase
VLVEARPNGDSRGYLMEVFCADEFAAAGIRGPFVQENHTYSLQGSLRGLHYQVRKPQGKLIRVVSGSIFDVAVDFRRSAPTYGRWFGRILSQENHLQLWIPPGFAHGLYVTSPHAEIIYKMTDVYTPEWERTVLWDDPTINIAWPLVHGSPPILSARDIAGVPFSRAEVFE